MNRRPLPFLLVVLTLAIAVSTSRSSPSTPFKIGSVTASTPMIEARSGHTSTLLADGRVLIAGGMRKNHDFYRSAELFDPASQRFQLTGEMTTQRVGHIAVLLPTGKVLIAGGWIGQGVTDTAELYDPSTGKFTRIASMTRRRAHPTATLLTSGDVLIAGGTDSDGPYDGVAEAEVFNASAATFKQVGTMKQARVAHTATLLKDGRVLIVGGRFGKVLASTELFDPKTGAFTESGPLHAARYKHTAGILPDGRVLIAGGSDERDWHGTVNTAEIYDPRTGTFSETTAMTASRFKLPDEAVQLKSGQLLIAGGSKQVEIFDPRLGRFVLVSGGLSNDWHYMSETRLQDGRVLLAGGYADNDRATAETWIYHP
jgi:Kelch motif/Galactose oxidase, central domain